MSNPDWQVDELRTPVDTSSVKRAARQVAARAENVRDADVRRAGLAFSASLLGVAKAYDQQQPEDPALAKMQEAWTNLRLTCGLPTVDPED